MKTIHCALNLFTPTKVVCIGRNYVEHIEELGNETPDTMVVFNKPNSAISHTLYYFDAHCRFEGEICFLIKEGGFYGFDHSAVLSPFVPLDVPLESLHMKLFINDTLVQFANFDLMIYKPEPMLAEIKSFMSLEDGDVIMSGTPKGVATYRIGDIFRGEIYSDGRLLVRHMWEAALKEGSDF